MYLNTYLTDTEYIMKHSNKKNSDELAALVRLHKDHRRFHKYLDKLSARSNDVAELDLIIELRHYNIECLNTYSGLIARTDVKLNPLDSQDRAKYELNVPEENMILWNIHGQLARFIPVYTETLAAKNLNRVSRMIISHNYDKLIRLKDNLLHPVKEDQLA